MVGDEEEKRAVRFVLAVAVLDMLHNSLLLPSGDVGGCPYTDAPDFFVVLYAGYVYRKLRFMLCFTINLYSSGKRESSSLTMLAKTSSLPSCLLPLDLSSLFVISLPNPFITSVSASSTFFLFERFFRMACFLSILGVCS